MPKPAPKPPSTTCCVTTERKCHDFDPCSCQRPHCPAFRHTGRRRMPESAESATGTARVRMRNDRLQWRDQSLGAPWKRRAIARIRRAYRCGSQRAGRKMDIRSVRADRTGRTPLRTGRGRHENLGRSHDDCRLRFHPCLSGLPGFHRFHHHQRRGRHCD